LIISARDTVRVYKGEGCWSFVGRIGATQSLSLGPGCESRDWADQFVLRTVENNYNYDLTAAVNNKPTMVPKDVLYTETLGSPFIGYYDLLMINKHYNCTDICKNKPSSCKNHGFPNPRDCNRCICPSGYGGPLCDRRPDGCGSELVATDKWQQFTDKLGEAGDSPREDFMKCNYWIKAPAGKKVQVKLVSFSKGVATDGCIYAGVEIKTHPDQRLTGYRQVFSEE
ncbi:astacin, partial [Teladorsagia circumcincta]